MPLLDRNTTTPLYRQIRDLLLEELQGGAIAPGGRIPSEAELGARYGVSRITVKQAIQALVHEGLLYRRQGKGTFVSRPRVPHDLNRITSFSQQMVSRGLHPTTRLLEAEIIAARGRVREALAVPGGTLVTKLRRLRLADGEPMGVQTAYIPVELCPDLIDALPKDASLYHLLKEKYRLSPVKALENYTAIVLDAHEARLLDVPEESPALAAERISYLPDNRALEYVVSILRADRYTLQVELQGEAIAAFPGQETAAEPTRDLGAS